MNILRLLCNKKITDVLISIHNLPSPTYYAKIARDSDCNYPYTGVLLNSLEASGLITLRKKGRMKEAVLTKEGERIVKHLVAIQELDVKT